jgi:hypothetical protein
VSPVCPVCGHHDVHHSRFRSWFERLRFNVTGLVPYRCHRCEWRGWRRDATPGGKSIREIHKQLTEDELDELDPNVEPHRR